MKARIAILAAALAALLAACSSLPKDIPADMGAQELIQRAQEATDANRYEAATAYYQALLDRFGSEPSYLCTAEYEIAFIAFKQERWAEARQGLERLLARYTGEGAAALPPRYKILAEKVLAAIAAKAGK